MALLTLCLLSPAFGNGDGIPVLYTADGGDLSPPLVWKGNFEADVYALVCTDPDAPSGEWIHWVVYNIPAGSRGLPEAAATGHGLPEGALQGTNSWGDSGYGGPAPPSGVHRYVFTLYALDRTLPLPAGASVDELNEAMEGHILQQAVLTGTYGRR